MNKIRSEQTKNLSKEELKKLQEKVTAMTPEELHAYRNSLDPDAMGFCGEESFHGIDD